MVIKEVLLLYNIFEYYRTVKYDDDSIYFIYKNKKYILKENATIDNDLFNYNYPSFFHKIIKNKYNSFYTIYNNKLYILYQLHDFRNNVVSFDNILKMSIPMNSYNMNKINYTNLWLRKNQYLQNYLDSKYRFFDLNYDYYLGMAEISLSFSKRVNFNNLTYGYCLKKNNCFTCFETLYDPSNIKSGPIVYNISEFIKYDFFKNNNILLKIDSIFDLNLNLDDYLFMICRLLYPNFYFDIFIDSENEIMLETFNIDSKVDKYISFLKIIFYEIKKRHMIDMSLIEYIINLL